MGMIFLMFTCNNDSVLFYKCFSDFTEAYLDTVNLPVQLDKDMMGKNKQVKVFLHSPTHMTHLKWFTITPQVVENLH